MAKRKTKKTITRYVKAKAPKRRKSSGMMSGVGGAVIGGGLYGASRGIINNMIAPLTNKIPGGVYADNLAMGVVDYLVYKNTSGMLKQAAKYGIAIESAMAGSEMTQGFGNPQINGGNW